MHWLLQQLRPAVQQVVPPGPHVARPGGQAQVHVPLMLVHCLPPLHCWPQPEQLALVPSLVGVHPAGEWVGQHLNPAGTGSPQSRQSVSVHRLTHVPLQHFWLEPQIGTHTPFWQVSQALQLRHFPVLGSQIWQEPQQAAGCPSGSVPQGWAPGIGTQVPFWQVSQALQLRHFPVLGSQIWQEPQQAAGCPSGSVPQGWAPGIGTQVPFWQVSQILQSRHFHVPASL